MEALLIGVAASFNLLIIYWKVEKKKYLNAALDGGLLFILVSIFSHSSGGAIIATIASAVISLVLLIRNPSIPINSTKINSFTEELKKRIPQ